MSYSVLALIILAAAAAPALLFVIIYAARSPWRSTEMGRHLMAFMGVCAAVLLLAVARRAFGQYPGYRWVGIGCYAAVAAIMWWRLLMLVRAQRAQRALAGRAPAVED